MENRVFREMHESGIGMRGIYNGIETAIIGRTVNLIARNLTYKLIYDQVKPVKPTNDLTNREKTVLAAVAGFVGTLVSNPFDVILTR